MNRNRTILIAAIGLMLAAVSVFAAVSAGRESSRGDRDYLVAVEAPKSDTVRMIEAYERLSSQYLELVQQNLIQMGAADRDILDKLTAIEKKLDDLAVRMERLEGQGTTK